MPRGNASFTVCFLSTSWCSTAHSLPPCPSSCTSPFPASEHGKELRSRERWCAGAESSAAWVGAAGGRAAPCACLTGAQGSPAVQLPGWLCFPAGVCFPKLLNTTFFSQTSSVFDAYTFGKQIFCNKCAMHGYAHMIFILLFVVAVFVKIWRMGRKNENFHLKLNFACMEGALQIKMC